MCVEANSTSAAVVAAVGRWHLAWWYTDQGCFEILKTTDMAPLPSADSCVQINEQVLFQELEGEAVLLNLKTGIYYGLDVVGTRIWELLKQQRQIPSVIESVVDEFEVIEKRCAEDLFRFLAELEKNGLITIA
jgi:Coenzyme PQQ synthesis protein D (PqqD)